uniref:Uncharacterized protein n=1 Tax=Anguilla anguilla TaxID=7936 RepID=A0A0E9QB46_ANGAN
MFQINGKLDNNVNTGEGSDSSKHILIKKIILSV